MFALPMNIYQQFTDFTQNFLANGHAVDARRRASVAAYLAREGHKVIGGVLLGQVFPLQNRPKQRFGLIIKRKYPFDNRSLCTSTYRSRVGFATQQQFYRVDDNRFTCASLTRDDIKAGGECQFKLVNDCKVANPKFV